MRAFTAASSSGAMCMPAAWNIGSDGYGAAPAPGSSIIESAKFVEAHADRAHAAPAAERMRVHHERAQPVVHRARRVRREGAELAGHAGARHHAEPVRDRDRPVWVAEELRHPHREAGVPDPAREARDVRSISAITITAGPIADYEDELRLAVEGLLAALEVLERVVLREVALRRVSGSREEGEQQHEPRARAPAGSSRTPGGAAARRCRRGGRRCARSAAPRQREAHGQRRGAASVTYRKSTAAWKSGGTSK